MPLESILAAAVISLLGLVPAPAGTATVYRIEMAGGQIAWAQDQPRDTGTVLLFHRHPDGLLVSVKKADVRRLSASAPPAAAARGPRPGKDLIVLGPTGGGPASPAHATNGAAPGAPAGAGQMPGQRKDGSALLNPDRKYKPEWDSRQVPGSNIGYPNSADDYKEGKTFAYPPAGSTQSAPGDLPRAPAGNGELPRGPGTL